MSHETHPSSIDLQFEQRRRLAHVLERQLSALFDLYSHVKQAHWNVRGPFFYARHELFDAVAGRLLGMVDDCAERIGALGFYASGTVRMSAETSYLKPYDSEAVSGQEHIRALVARFGDVVAELRTTIATASELDDPITEDLVTEMLRTVEKDLWFLESHLDPASDRVMLRIHSLLNGGAAEAPTDEPANTPRPATVAS